jgi:hypothetical protein
LIHRCPAEKQGLAMMPMEEFAHDTRRWARQTIIFTMQFGLTDASTEAEEHAQVRKASDKSVAILSDLWATAETGSHGGAQTVRNFVRLVLEWSSQNLPAADKRKSGMN